MSYRILLVEDDPQITEVIRDYFLRRREPYELSFADNATAGMVLICENTYDLVLLDVMLPGMDGFSVLRALRKEKVSTPVLMLTARTELEDRLTGLDSGADYYLPKPFESAELISCLHAITRRGSQAPMMSLKQGDITLEQKDGKLKNTENGQDVKLGAKEFQLMELFMENPRILFSVQQLMDRVWGWDAEAEINVVWVNISTLRKKIAELDTSVEIRVHRGTGYSLEKKA